jgi:hypothetical protein
MSVHEAVLGAIAAAVISQAFQKVDWAALYKSFNESIQEFWLARPFLLGMPANELRLRFHVKLVSQSEKELRLRFVPKAGRDQAFYSQAVLILTKEKYEPRALKMIHPDGRETVHVFSDVRVNSNWKDVYHRSDPLSRPDLRGYRSANVVTGPKWNR